MNKIDTSIKYIKALLRMSNTVLSIKKAHCPKNFKVYKNNSCRDIMKEKLREE